VTSLARLLEPGNLFVAALCAAAIVLFYGGARHGRMLVAACATAALVIAVLPVGSWLLRPLERHFPAVALPAHVDGVVVLGGALEHDRIVAHRRLGLGEAGDRIVAFAQIAHRHPHAALYFAGGRGSLGPRGLGDALPAREFFESLGIEYDRVTLEETASSTHENAAQAAASGLFEPGTTWVLVTSAWHMPRAVGCFRAHDIAIVPYAVDYRDAPGLAFDFSGALARLELGAREWAALAYYRLRGRTRSLLPDIEPAT
jgi:uncharacterized SAM-binding protein YcdF (DUF218 family)